jgi:8-oxo-dGTP diphosphatase
MMPGPTSSTASPSASGLHHEPASAPQVPYKIAVLVYVFNDAGQLLLLHRRRPPNKDLYSPIGGKLEQQTGESPHACALREIEEEIGVRLGLDDLRLLGIVSERAYTWNAATTPSAVAMQPSPAGEGAGAPSPAAPAAHWLMFCFEVTRRLNFPARDMNEGRLEWMDPIILKELDIPKTDREVIWPLVEQYSRQLHPSSHHRQHETVFCVHIDCTDADHFIVTHEHPRPAQGT